MTARTKNFSLMAASGLIAAGLIFLSAGPASATSITYYSANTKQDIWHSTTQVANKNTASAQLADATVQAYAGGLISTGTAGVVQTFSETTLTLKCQWTAPDWIMDAIPMNCFLGR